MGPFLRRCRPKQRNKAAWGSADPRTGAAAVLRRLCYAVRGASCGEGAGGCFSSSRGAFWPSALPNVGRGCASEMSPGACWLCRLPKRSPQLPEGVEHHGAKVGPAGRLLSGGSGINRVEPADSPSRPNFGRTADPGSSARGSDGSRNGTFRMTRMPSRIASAVGRRAAGSCVK